MAASPPAPPSYDSTCVSTHELGRKWKGVPWADVMEGEGTAPYLFMRSGLIRKDLLPRYAPEGSLPRTVFMVCL